MNAKLTEILASIEARANAATPGPWSTYDNSFDAGVVNGLRPAKEGEYSYSGSGICYDTMICGGEPSEGHFEGPDADFVAASRTDIPKLLAVVKKLMEQRNKWADYGGGLEMPKQIEAENAVLLAILSDKAESRKHD